MYVDEPLAASLYRCKTESVEFTRWMTALQALALQLAGYKLVLIRDAEHPTRLLGRHGARQ